MDGITDYIIGRVISPKPTRINAQEIDHALNCLRPLAKTYGERIPCDTMFFKSEIAPGGECISLTRFKECKESVRKLYGVTPYR